MSCAGHGAFLVALSVCHVTSPVALTGGLVTFLVAPIDGHVVFLSVLIGDHVTSPMAPVGGQVVLDPAGFVRRAGTRVHCQSQGQSHYHCLC